MASLHILSSSLPFILFMVLFLYPSQSTDPKTQEWIDKICLQTVNYAFCSQTFYDNLESQSSTDIAGLSQLTIELALKNATNTFTYAWTVLNNATTGKKTKPVLAECVKDYQSVIRAFLHASMEFTGENYRKMVAQESAAVKPLDACDSGFDHNNTAEPENPFLFLVERNEQMRILISMSAIAGLYLVP